jgi:excisionase family DNA binding protein
VERLLTKAEAAQALNLSVRSLDRLRKRGSLEAVRLLGAVRFRPEAIQALVQEGQGAAAKDAPTRP